MPSDAALEAEMRKSDTTSNALTAAVPWSGFTSVARILTILVLPAPGNEQDGRPHSG